MHSVDLRLSTDDLVAHAAFPLSEIRAGQMQEALSKFGPILTN